MCSPGNPTTSEASPVLPQYWAVLLASYPYSPIDKTECGYVCDCNREKIDKVIVSLQKTDVDELIELDGQIEVVCQFCNKKYTYNKQQAYEVCGFKE